MKTTLIGLYLLLVLYSNSQTLLNSSEKFVNDGTKPRRFCELISPTTDLEPMEKNFPSSSTKSQDNVGNNFILDYEDHNNNTFYASAVWDVNSTEVISTAKKVLEDIDAFFVKNSLSNCGYPNQRIVVSLRPYIQSWVDNNLYTSALGVASQSAWASDLDYLSQNCPSPTPNVHLAFSNSPVGTLSAIYIGYIYLNPTIANFNLNYPTTTSSSEYDLYSVLLHELTHILGINVNDYRFKELLHSGATPLNSNGVFSCADDPNYMTLGISGCSNISCIGNYTNDPVHAPPVWDVSSSLSHFPDDCAGTPLGGNVMNPGIFMGQEKRSFHQREVNALQDLGYNFTNPFNGVNYNLNNTNYVVGLHDGILVQTDMEAITACESDTYQPIVNTICDAWPLILNPLSNDINATLITEAVVKTGNANATVAITGVNNDQLSFTATVPGIYTIAYIPASTDRTGLPTYIQVNVPSCGENDLDDVTCNDDPNCNQICMGDVFEHTLLYGDFAMQPTFYSNGSFEYSCRKNLSGVNEPCYSSVFFWVNTDQSSEYTLSLKRSYSEIGPTSSGNPHVKTFAYLVHSTDMLNGQYNQTSNNFPSLPTNKQLVYEELFTADTYPLAPVSFCFTTNSDYDMLIFYDEQVTNFTTSRYGKVKIQDLEFLEKESINLPTSIAACMPQTLTLGEEFCSASTNTLFWKNQNNTVLTTNAVYSPGNITTAIDDEYTFTMNYPSLPTTVITPSSNVSCNFSQSIPINIVECCTGATQPFLHPITSVSTGRTFGMDVDGSNNGAVYYSGALHNKITFGSQSISDNSLNPIGFLLKIDQSCVKWLKKTNFAYSKLEVTNLGKEIFYLGGKYTTSGGSLGPDKYNYLARFNYNNGLEVWEWNTNPDQVEITDFTVNESQNLIFVTGRMITSSFDYSGTTISGSQDDIFVLKISYTGVYLGHTVIPVNGSLSDSRIISINNRLILAFTQTTSTWTLVRLSPVDLSVFSSPAAASIATTGQNTFEISGLEMDGSFILGQLVYTSDISYNGSNILLGGNDKKTGYFKVSSNTLTSPTSSFLSNVVHITDRLVYDVDMDVSNGKAVFSYNTTPNEIHVRAIDVSTGATIWDKISTGLTTSDWISSKGVKITPSGVYNTSCFFEDAIIDNTDIIVANPGPTTFYGVKYQESNGAILAIEANETVGQFENIGIQILDLDTHNLSPITVYPNPGNGLYTIKAEGDYQVAIRDIQGKIIGQLEGNGQSNFDITNQSKGIYLIEILCENETQVFKLIKE